MTTENWINIVGATLVFSGFVFAIIKYSQEKKREFQKRFFEEQLKYYQEAVNNAAIISLYDKQDNEYKEAVLNFKRLFRGHMCIVEDKEVYDRMEQFDKLLNLYETAGTDHLDKIKNQFQYFALVLAQTCRNSSISTWQIKYKLGFTDTTLDMQGDKARIDFLIESTKRS